MFNVSIREHFLVLNVFIVCIRNTARSKSNPLLCTHVDSYMFNTLPPLGILTILRLYSFLFLEFIIYLRASSQNFVENHNLVYFYHILNKVLIINCSVSPTCTVI